MPEALNPVFVYEARVRMSSPTKYNQEVDLVRNYVFIAGDGVGLTINDAASAFRDSFRLNPLTQLSSLQSVARYEMRSITGRAAIVPAPPPPRPAFRLTYGAFVPIEGVTPTDNGGRLAGNLLPPTDSVSIEVRGDGVGRRAYGMARVGFVGSLDATDGLLTPGGRAAFGLIAQWMRIDVPIGAGTDVLRPVIFNRTLFLKDPGIATPVLATRPVVSAQLAEITGTQLTRKRPIRRPGY